MRVVLVDDHDGLRGALRELLSGDVRLDVVAEGRNGAEACALARQHRPDLMLMDISMPGMDGIAATATILAEQPAVRIVALSSFRDASSVSAMIAAGARGYLLKTAPPEDILAALDAVLIGRPVLAPEVLQGVLDDLGALYRDERARAEGLAEIDRMKRSFIALVSDELRTPLTAITGYAGTLRHGWDRLDDPTRREFLDGIRAQTERLGRRVEQMLTVAGLAGDAPEAGRQFYALEGVAREACDRLAEHLGRRHVVLDLPAVTAVGDRSVALTAAVTLIENAVDHAVGTITVRVAAAGPEAVLTVSDDGPGLADDVRARLAWEPFAQGHASDTRPVTGLGLSLYIARRALETDGGRLEIDSAAGRGSTVRAILPRAGADGPSPAAGHPSR